MPVANRSRWKSGVYLITNTVNNKVYVGSAARSIKHRWFRHRRLLRAGIHTNAHLQSAWNKYGESVFVFTILVNCKPEDCVRYEQLFIDRHKAFDRASGYNISPTAGSCLGVKHTDETRERMSKAHTGKKNSAEHVAKVAAANRCLKRSAESRAKMSAARKGRKMSAESLEKLVATNTGRPLSDEHKAKLSKAAKCRSSDCYKKGWETRRDKKEVKWP